MKRPADHTFHISKYCIDCDKIIHDWHSIIGDTGYHLLNKNCSTVVMDVLRFSVLCKKVRPETGITDIFTPNDVKQYGQKLQTLTSCSKLRAFRSTQLKSCANSAEYECDCGILCEEGLWCEESFCCYFKCCMYICCYSFWCGINETCLTFFNHLYQKVTSCCNYNLSFKHNKYEEIHDV